jgi:hypothetical protein
MGSRNRVFGLENAKVLKVRRFPGIRAKVLKPVFYSFPTCREVGFLFFKHLRHGIAAGREDVVP